jgi:cytoskeletal protein CcmA (bactofilin family)
MVVGNSRRVAGADSMLRFRKSGPRPIKDPGLPRDVLGFLGEGTVIQGSVDLEGGFRVDGRISGPVHSLSTLVVGPTGEIASEDLRVRTLSVSGQVRGKARVEERLEIRRGGLVEGAIEIGRAGFVIEPGGRFEGTIRLRVEEPEGAPAA